MITRVLVANRGEIARRVFATCRRLGIGTVAVYTDPDTASPHVSEADRRVRIDSYLSIPELVRAARLAGADAIHPGYGFLSENAVFAATVIDEGLTWIGPPAAAVTAMGSKIEAKKLMAAAGVPVMADLDPESITTEQLPILVKASAGGGGRGMRVVDDLADLDDAVSAARREAAGAFGDGAVFSYVPPSALVDPARLGADADLELADLVYFDCPDEQLVVHRHAALDGEVLAYFKRPDRWVAGRYLFTIEWWTGNHLAHAVALASGQYAVLPHHKLKFGSGHAAGFEPYKKIRKVWKVGRGPDDAA